MNELIVKKDDQYMIDPQIADSIAEYEVALKVLSDKYDELKQALKTEMVNKKIRELTADDGERTVTIQCVTPTDTEYFDKTKFRKDYPSIYNKYISMKKSAPRMTIKVK